MPLTQYKQKRKFSKTTEPEPKIKSSKSKNVRFSSEAKEKSRFSGTGRENRKKPLRLFSFVVHEHKATHLHWDLRLEIDGVLKSWAVPKEPPKTKGTKRLAILVEDHPLDYAKFKGEIPEGQYGAGKVEIWDKGTYILESKKSNKIVFELHGKKLKGKYVLINAKLGGEKNNWLFFKI